MTVVKVTISRRDTADTAITAELRLPFSIPLGTKVVSLASEGLTRSEVVSLATEGLTRSEVVSVASEGLTRTEVG